MLTILEFHNISNRGVAWTKVPQRRFSRILDILQAETNIISPLDLSRSLYSPDDKANVMITFDDGYEDIYTKAFPIMRSRGITGMVSIVAGFSGRTNLWDIGGGGLRHLDFAEIDRLLDAGWSICSHTMTHPDLKRCTDDRLEWELVQSRKVLERRLGMEISTIAYPFGRFNARVIVATGRAGYKIGFTVGAETWRGKRGPLTIRRVPVYQIDSDALIRAKVKPDGVLKKIDASKNRLFNKASLLTSFLHRHRFKGIPDH